MKTRGALVNAMLTVSMIGYMVWCHQHYAVLPACTLYLYYMSSHDELLETVGGTRAKAIKKFRWACGGCVFFLLTSVVLSSLLIFISIQRTK